MTKVVFETATLADSIKNAERIAPNRGQAFDKAAGIVMVVSGPGLPVVIKSTNLEIFRMEWVDYVSVEGEPTTWRIPSLLFAQVMASLPIGTGKQVTLEEVNTGHASHVLLSSGRTKAKFYLMDNQYYPEWDVFDPDDLFTISDLGGRLAMVDWAAAKTGIPLSGVNLTGEFAIATDRYRLAATPMPVPQIDKPITIPGGILSQVLKQTGEVQVGSSGNMLLIMPDEATQIRSVIYAEDYPGVSKILEKKADAYENKITLRKGEALEVLKRAAGFAGSDRIPVMRLFIGKGELAVFMANEEIGTLGDIIDLPGQADHDRWEVRFSPKNIIDPITNCPNETMEFHYNMSGGLMYIDGGSGYEAWMTPITKQQEAEGA
jgi:DNA polymerase III sliding clamp (beta) subunit (PCNA family)